MYCTFQFWPYASRYLYEYGYEYDYDYDYGSGYEWVAIMHPSTGTSDRTFF